MTPTDRDRAMALAYYAQVPSAAPPDHVEHGARLIAAERSRIVEALSRRGGPYRNAAKAIERGKL